MQALQTGLWSKSGQLATRARNSWRGHLENRRGRKYPMSDQCGKGQLHCVATRPRVCARDTACARLSTPSLVKTLLRCDFTVSGPISRLRAISLLENPSAISVRMSVSRGLNGLKIRAPEVGAN